ncbi:ML domain-domain-containing protein [Syncephalastrum racemosum]|uniref:Phosphatidylglycerol/phosphatidylinositol transfer protein n=1 Tax=Syncephalastrum racemosum TaxID=13706 RepID=A0A1X2HQH8_SYNRA|nr:ML domain-domain-containing protein [Syncephalastrum racemosum]
MYRCWTLYFVFILAALHVANAIPAWMQLDYFAHFDWSPTKTDYIEDCSDDSYILKIDDITLTPAHPQPGKDLLIEASGTLKETVDVGSVADVRVKIGVVQLLHKQFDLCDELDKSQIEEECPVQPGRLKVSQKVTLPKEIPKALFHVDVAAYDQYDRDLACLRIKIDFRRHRYFDTHELILD